MSNNQMHLYREERDALLERAIQLLLADERIVAAWLYGSIGRNSYDVWSDLDLWIIVADEYIAAVSAERADFLTRVGPTLLTVEAPQNAPLGGAYLLGMYAGAYGPQILDCSWQPRSTAKRPHDTRLLFDKVGIPLAEMPTGERPATSLDQARHDTAFFWMMATIVGKYIARRNDWEVLKLLSFVWSVIARIEYYVGERHAMPTYRDTPPFPVSANPADLLAALRTMVASMEALTERTPALQDAISPDTIPQVRLYLQTIEASLST